MGAGSHTGQCALRYAAAAACLLQTLPLVIADGVSSTATQSHTCGITSVFDQENGEIAVAGSPLTCHRVMGTNCSNGYDSINCPSTCKFVAPSKSVACFLSCVPARDCGIVNPDLAFPNPSTGVCSKCTIPFCRSCALSDLCNECHEGFRLANAGTQCAFDLEEKFPLRRTLCVLLVVLLLLIAGAIWHCERYGRHPLHVANQYAIDKAKVNRHRLKVQDWNFGEVGKEKGDRAWYPLTVNVHTKNIMGLGLGMFYNSICFLALLAALYAVVTYQVFHASGGAHFLVVSNGQFGPEGSLRQMCGETSLADTRESLQRFSVLNFRALGFLYVVSFILSLGYGAVQKRYAWWFDRWNLTMSDYALILEGLPPDAVDEEELRSWVESELRRAVSPEPSRRGGAQIEIVGVSICYDYRAHRDFVEDALWKLAVNMDPESTLQEHIDIDEARALFEGPDRLKSSGEAFVVFRYAHDAEAVWARSHAQPDFLRHPRDPEATPRLRQTSCEPPCIAWWHYGMDARTRGVRLLSANVKILVLLAIVQLCLVYPFVKYVMLPYARSGAAASGKIMVVAGMVLGWVNMLLSIQIYFTSFDLGFKRKDDMDVLIFWMNAVVTLVNTVFNMFGVVAMVIHDHGGGNLLAALIEADTLVSLGMEYKLARNTFLMLCPGIFFIGYFMFVLQGGMLPFCWNLLLMKMIYVWRCFPRPLLYLLKVFLPWAPQSLDLYSLRHAEKGLEPMEIGLAWDSASIIILPSLCFATLFFVSPYVWQTFLAMFCWACFFYCWCRYLHLRFMKGCLHTTSRLNTSVNFAWGLPLSVVAAAWCTWGLRSGELGVAAATRVSTKLALIVTTFIASLVAWAGSYSCLVRPLEIQDAAEMRNKAIERVQEDTVYSWFNCNPAFVLKCACVYKEAPPGRHPRATCGPDATVKFYEMGREWLIIRSALPKGSALDTKAPSSFLEFETHIEWLLDMLGRCNCLDLSSCRWQSAEMFRDSRRYEPLEQPPEDAL